MDLVSILITLVVLGLIVWLVETYIPMDAMFRNIFRIVLVIGVCLWLLRLVHVL